MGDRVIKKWLTAGRTLVRPSVYRDNTNSLILALLTSCPPPEEQQQLLCSSFSVNYSLPEKGWGSERQRRLAWAS